MKVSEFLILTVFAFSMFACKSNKTSTQDQPTVMIEKVILPPDHFMSENSEYDEDVVTSPIVEEPPLFDGKHPEIGFREYVNKNLTYPEVYADASISGRVIVEFIIEKDGSISNAKVIRSLDPPIDAEALRVINNSPANWKPAEQRGKAVRYRYIFSVIFKLTSE
jgi:TonB family protein